MSKRILLVDKTGVIKESMIKSFNTTDLYKKAGFKTNEGFKNYHSWNVEIVGKKYAITLYGKTTGMTPEVAASLQKSLLSPMVDKDSFVKQIAAARQASDLARRRQAAGAKALTVPLTIPGATEQNR